MPLGAKLLQLEDNDRKSIPGATSENLGATRPVGAHLAGATVYLSVEGSIARPKAYSRAQTDVIIKSNQNQIKGTPAQHAEKSLGGAGHFTGCPLVSALRRFHLSLFSTLVLYT